MRGLLQVLLIPAAVERPGQILVVEYSAVAFSDAIGGGLLADIYYSNHLTQPGETGASDRFCLYADEDRVIKQLPDNARAAVLAARLGCIGDLRSIPLTGDVLVSGATRTNDDTHVPGHVLTAAERGGLLLGTPSQTAGCGTQVWVPHPAVGPYR